MNFRLLIKAISIFGFRSIGVPSMQMVTYNFIQTFCRNHYGFSFDSHLIYQSLNWTQCYIFCLT